MPLSNGATFAGFRIVRLLGSGGMGEVYLAQHPRLPKQIALKILPAANSSDSEFRERFAREADLAATLYHPHIVGVHDRGESDGQLWIAMDFVEGADAGHLLTKRHPAGMPLDQVVAIVSAVAGALDYAHRRGMLHRDVKPANIMVTNNDQGEQRILLTDFGIARNLDDISGLTATNMTVGTVAYAAPEQLMGEDVDGRADQYALAATAYHLLTGSQLFPHSNPAVVISRHLNAPPPKLRDLRPDLGRLDEVLAVALAKNPDDRFTRCSDFARALADGAIPHRAVSPSAPTAAAPAAPRPAKKSNDSAAASAAVSRKRVPAAPPPPPHRSTGLIVGLVLAALVLGSGAVALTVVKLSSPSDNLARSTPTSENSASPALDAPEPAACGEGDALLAAMSTRDKLAQLLMVGVTGANDARAVVAKDHVGGIEIESTTDLTMLGDPLKEIAASAGALPLAVSTDEEGGRVSRLKSLIGVQESARVLGRTVSPQEVYDIALARGKAMKDLGFTVDFAPVVDVSDQDDDTQIGDRSFSADPKRVTEYAGAYARGLLEAGITPVLKHFPGHGHASGDSHEGGVVTTPLSELMNDDLVPYRELAQVPGTAVMVGHMQVPGLTGADPASLSPAAYDLLRTGGYGGLPFDGVVFTDDLSRMGAITQRYSLPDAALKALQAGADIALWISSDDVPVVLDRLEAAVAAGELDLKRVDASVLRIAGLKGKSPLCGG